MNGCGCDECVKGHPCIPVFVPVPVVYSGRACRGYDGVVRRRFWCDACERVTS